MSLLHQQNGIYPDITNPNSAPLIFNRNNDDDDDFGAGETWITNNIIDDKICVSNYNRLRDLVADKASLFELFKMSAAMFSDEVLSEIKNLATLKEFNINTQLTAARNTLLGVYSSETNKDRMASMEKLLDVYFRAIAIEMQVLPETISVPILSLLRIKIKIAPNPLNIQSIRNPTVAVSTSYKPPNVPLATIRSDITSIINQQLDIVKDTVQKSNFSFTPIPTRVELRGPIIEAVAKNVVLLQEMMLQQANNMKVAAAPFISTYKY